MALVASLEGGLHVARAFFRHRSESDERMLITTVRLSGWWGLEVLKSLACARCWSWTGEETMAVSAPAGAMSGPSACAAVMTCCGRVRAWAMPADISLGSVRMDIFLQVTRVFLCNNTYTRTTLSSH